ncbi:MAG: YheU family protein [Roseibacillus sp.]|jgi:uncharacterized protein YheU (UPF0270 family)|tara:strand:- start:96 stop:311 length:216 start_codon:yes stop_codon:yes gene_type:complete
MESDAESGIRIPFEQLPPPALAAVIEEFVTRDGTEMTDARRKIDQVTELLRRGEVEVWFDQVTKTCNILRV